MSSNIVLSSFSSGYIQGDTALADSAVYKYCEAERLKDFIRFFANAFLNRILYTNSRLPAGKVVRVYNGRGDIENLIK